MHYSTVTCRYKGEDGQPFSLQEQLQGFRDSVLRIPAAIANYYAAYVSLSKSANLVATDLHNFLTSDSSEIPWSLHQCGRLLETGVSGWVCQFSFHINWGAPPAPLIMRLVYDNLSLSVLSLRLCFALKVTH